MSPFLAEFLGTTLRVLSGDVVVANVRLAHALLPIPSKGTSDWGYACVPVIGPIIGGVGAWVNVALWTA
jgi:glycerol uptake facilitator-like aquaporin